MRKLITSAVAFLSAVMAPVAALSQESYPSRPVMVIAPSSPGAGFELHGRFILQKLGKVLGQSFVLDFKPGAAQTIGTAFVARAKPDGYTLLFTSGAHVLGNVLYKDLSYDPIRSFESIGQTTIQPVAFVVESSVPAKNFREFVDFVKKNKGKINMGVSGLGASNHLAGAWLNEVTGMDMTFVAYKGSGQLLTGLMSKDVHAGMPTVAAVIPHIQSGRLRALAVTGSERSAGAPDIPTIKEQGYPEYSFAQWQGFLAPAGTPDHIVKKLSSALQQVMRDPETIAHMNRYGDTAVAGTPENFKRLMVSETERWTKMAQGLNIEKQ